MDPTALSPTQPDLDLAFEADDSLPAELLDQAGDLDPFIQSLLHAGVEVGGGASDD